MRGGYAPFGGADKNDVIALKNARSTNTIWNNGDIGYTTSDHYIVE